MQSLLVFVIIVVIYVYVHILHIMIASGDITRNKAAVWIIGYLYEFNK